LAASKARLRRPQPKFRLTSGPDYGGGGFASLIPAAASPASRDTPGGTETVVAVVAVVAVILDKNKNKICLFIAFLPYPLGKSERAHMAKAEPQKPRNINRGERGRSNI